MRVDAVLLKDVVRSANAYKNPARALERSNVTLTAGERKVLPAHDI